MQQIFGEGTVWLLFLNLSGILFFCGWCDIWGCCLRGGLVGHAGLRRPLQRKPHHRKEVAVAHRERHARHGGQVQRPRHASEGSYKCLSSTSNVLWGGLVTPVSSSSGWNWETDSWLSRAGPFPTPAEGLEVLLYPQKLLLDYFWADNVWKKSHLYAFPFPRRSWKSKWRGVKPLSWSWCSGTTGNQEQEMT